jgi:hypothetical protein
VKRLAVVCSLFLLAAVISSATPVACSTVTPTLNNFEALGAGGCSIGNLLFSNFADVPTSTSGSFNISANSIAITLINGPNIGIDFSAGWGIGNGANNVSQFQDDKISFVVSTLNGAPTLKDVGLDFNGAFTGTGLTTVVEKYCPGANTVVGCANAGQVSVTNPPLQLHTETLFTSAVNMIAIQKDISLVSGTFGTTSISDIDQTFSQVPEPGTLLLLGSALTGLGLFRRSQAKRSA